MTEEEKKRITKIDNLTFASWGIRDAIRHIEVCCEACGKCEMRKQGCRVAYLYKKLKNMHQLLSEEIDELEKSK